MTKKLIRNCNLHMTSEWFLQLFHWPFVQNELNEQSMIPFAYRNFVVWLEGIFITFKKHDFAGDAIVGSCALAAVSHPVKHANEMLADQIRSKADNRLMHPPQPTSTSFDPYATIIGVNGLVLNLTSLTSDHPVF